MDDARRRSASSCAGLSRGRHSLPWGAPSQKCPSEGCLVGQTEPGPGASAVLRYWPALPSKESDRAKS